MALPNPFFMDRQALLDYIGQVFGDNTSEQITPEDARDGFTALIYSLLVLKTDVLSVNQLRGGTHLKPTLAARDAIAPTLRVVGMSCVVVNPASEAELASGVVVEPASYQLVAGGTDAYPALINPESDATVNAQWVLKGNMLTTEEVVNTVLTNLGRGLKGPLVAGVPTKVLAGEWWLTSTGIWQASKNMTATAAPIPGANWQLLLGAGAGSYQPIAENQYGIHPKFDTEPELHGFLLYALTQGQGVGAPSAPGLSNFDDVANTVVAAHPDYPASELRYDLPGNGGTNLAVPADGIIRAGNVAGQVAVYVRAKSGRAQGLKAYSPAFTVAAPIITPTAPDFSGFDDLANKVYVSHPNYSYLDLRYDFGGQTGLRVSATGLVEVGDTAGQVTAYVVADASQNRAEGAKAYSRPFTQGGIVITPPTPTPLAVAFTLPNGNTLTAGQNLSFSASASGGTAPYSHEVTATNTATGTVTGIASAIGAQYSGIWQNVPAGEYDLVDTVTDAASTSKISTSRHVVVSAVVTGPGVPGQVAQPTAQASSGQVVLTYPAPANNGAPITSYTAQYRPIGATSWSVFGSTANLTITVTGLTNGITYEFRVAATNSAGIGAYSNSATATPVASTGGGTGTKPVIDWFAYGSPDQSNGSGLSVRAEAGPEYYNTNPLALGFDLTRNVISTFSLGRIENGKVVEANDHAITQELVPSYENGIGPMTGFVKRHLENTVGNPKEFIVTNKDLTPPVSTNSATTDFWLSTLLAGWKQEITNMVALLKERGHAGVNPYFFAGLGEGNGDTAQGISGYKAGMISLLDQMIAHVNSLATPTFSVGPVRVGIVIKQQTRYLQSIVPIQRQLAAEYPNALAIELPNFDPATGFLAKEQPGGTHYTTSEILRLGAYQADQVAAGWVPVSLTPTISDFNPKKAPPGTVVTITGTNFKAGTTVKFGGSAAVAATLVSSTQITATVPVGAGIGYLEVIVPGGGTVTKAGFIGHKTFAFTANPDVVKTGNDLTTPSRDGAWGHTVMGSQVLPDGVEGEISIDFDGITGLAFIGLHDSPTPYDSFRMKYGLYLEPLGDGTGRYALRIGSGNVVTPQFVLNPAVAGTRYAVRRTIGNGVFVVRYTNGLPAAYVAAGAEGGGVNVSYTGDMWGTVTLLGDANAKAVDPRTSW